MCVCVSVYSYAHAHACRDTPILFQGQCGNPVHPVLALAAVYGKFQGNWLSGLAEGRGAWVGEADFLVLKRTSPSIPNT